MRHESLEPLLPPESLDELPLSELELDEPESDELESDEPEPESDELEPLDVSGASNDPLAPAPADSPLPPEKSGSNEAA